VRLCVCGVRSAYLLCPGASGSDPSPAFRDTRLRSHYAQSVTCAGDLESVQFLVRISCGLAISTHSPEMADFPVCVGPTRCTRIVRLPLPGLSSGFQIAVQKTVVHFPNSTVSPSSCPLEQSFHMLLAILKSLFQIIFLLLQIIDLLRNSFGFLSIVFLDILSGSADKPARDQSASSNPYTPSVP